MSILQDDLEQYSAIDLVPHEGLHRPSPGSTLAIDLVPHGGLHRPSPGSTLAIDLVPHEGLHRPSPGSPLAIDLDPHEGLYRPSPGSRFAIDLDPHKGLHRPSPGSPLAIGEQLSDTENEESIGEQLSDTESEEPGWVEDLCHAICDNNWSATKAILDQHPTGLAAGIFGAGRTALHVAAQCGNITIVRELLELLPRDSLLTRDSLGDTALGIACWNNGNTQIAKCLVNKNREIAFIPTKRDLLPVIHAFDNDFKEMGRYLYSVTHPECFTGPPDSQLLRVCLQAQCFDIALNLLQQHEELLFVPNDNKNTPVHQIATLNTVILSRSELIFWKRWIYDWHGLLLRFIPFIDNFVGVKKIQELKLLHAQVDDLLLLVCRNARKAFQNKDKALAEAVLLAAKEGNVEFVLQVSRAIPEILIRRLMVDSFTVALNNRQAGVFNLIHGLRFKLGTMASVLDDDYNTLMHSAARRAPDHILNRIYAPTLQMQRELQWFKEVESLMPLRFRAFRNKEGLTAKELFRKSHRELMKEGEKWIKDTASSCSVVGTLIVTIMFAAAFTVPGGNDQNLGHPIFIKQPFFKVFIFSTTISFFSSSTSVLMFLAIINSKYSEEKFLKSLPLKLILGLSFLFISIVSMITAFLSTTYLMLNHTNYSWGLLPIMILASVPIFLFVLSQFPLLLHTYASTYGNLFDRNVKLWP